MEVGRRCDSRKIKQDVVGGARDHNLGCYQGTMGDQMELEQKGNMGHRLET